MDNSGKDLMGNAEFSAQDILYMLRDLPDACCVFKVVTDPFGTVKDMLFLFVNEKYASLVGKPTSELIGSTYYTTVSNRDEDWIKLSYQAAIMRQSVINSTYNTQFNRWFEFWAVPVYQKGFCAFIIHDVTAEKRKEEKRVITTNSTNVILDCAKELSRNEFKKGVKHALNELGKVLHADRVGIIESKHGKLGEIHFWSDRVSGIGLPTKKVFEECDFFTLWNHQLKDKDVYFAEDITEISGEDVAAYRSILEGSISRYIVSALRDKSHIIGYLVVDNYSLDLDVNVKEVVESISIFLSEEVKNYRLAQEMAHISAHDELTGLGNRNAYAAADHMLEELNVSIGVCFIDINGLKMYNEEHGHDGGDNVIKEVATIMGSAFKKKYCYRIGGDEFVALIPQISEEHFYEQVDKLKKKAKNVSIAVGAVWADTAEDVKGLVNQADRLMHVDKTDYFKEHDRRHK
ncbi:sensor domain-containing diguanylate cyclase [Pseudobutyrivibrio xylanivorans]|uniref:GGDEF domain-containing protein n=1 Tax=Pseudobutyrivibrio xylanivorans TaxID=185007 RepID=A0A5P6VNV8_PSEXY|nr:sensor domain-containing diguanylate cyclase [Pseudobutyrivibrio xylanivorans]QFJ54120.1 GGDEF domain-containing protein [Pseudobutyrivibrio xylanivorans]